MGLVGGVRGGLNSYEQSTGEAHLWKWVCALILVGVTYWASTVGVTHWASTVGVTYWASTVQ